MYRLTLLIAIFIGACASFSQHPLMLELEQSGGIGGIPEYMLRIDTNGTAILERWSGWSERSSVRIRLSRSDYQRLRMLCLYARIQQLDTLTIYDEPVPRPDAPTQILTYYDGSRRIRIIARSHVPDTLYRLLRTLDSLAHHIGRQ